MEHVSTSLDSNWTRVPRRHNPSVSRIFSQRYSAGPSKTHFYSRHSSGHTKGGAMRTTSAMESLAHLPKVLSSRHDEKHQLTTLNTRFAGYIDKVMALEAKNKLLTTKITQMQSQSYQNSEGGSAKTYEEELARLHDKIRNLANEKANVELKLQNCEDDLYQAEARLEDEANARAEAEKNAKELRDHADKVSLQMHDKENEIEALREQYDVLRASMKEDIEKLNGGGIIVKHEEMLESAPGPAHQLADALKDIRDSYEQLSTDASMQMTNIYKKKIGDLQAQLRKANDAVLSAKADATAYNNNLQACIADLAGLQSANSSLQSQYESLQDNIEREREEASTKIQDLEDQLQKAQADLMECYGQYNKILNLKQTFEAEIDAYRVLLEFEEDRIEKKAENLGGDHGVVKETVTVTETQHSTHSFHPGRGTVQYKTANQETRKTTSLNVIGDDSGFLGHEDTSVAKDEGTQNIHEQVSEKKEGDSSDSSSSSSDSDHDQ